MGFDDPTRKLLAKIVSTCRDRLAQDITEQLQSTYGLHPDGTVVDVGRTEDDRRATEDLLALWDHFEAAEAGSAQARRTVAHQRMVREIGFTLLNRLAALRLCEERGLLIECVRRGMASDGFRLYDQIAGGALGNRYQAYRAFLEGLFDELALDLGVLFDRTMPQSLVFPSEAALGEVLTQLNDAELARLGVWQQDETIGWIYQYYNDPAERKAMRDASQAPRNSRELAVRNQFFTPRYVVEFLTDNTLGRLWYEMRQGNTRLVEQCRYLVRRPKEIFLRQGEQAPQEQERGSDLSQEELLRQPVHIPHRPKKDPRDLKILDPAKGSGHFLLYGFDLMATIYEEAWADPDLPPFSETGTWLARDYADLADLRVAIPGLILRHNLYGIDIDPRAVQIAALALWLRAQRAYQELGLASAYRPRITRSNTITAEPMPGDRELLEEFLRELRPRVLGDLVRVVFDKMKLAGETGSLLKIEQDLEEALAEAHQQWAKESQPEQLALFPELRRPKAQQPLLFDVSGITDAAFWDTAEERVLEELQRYASQAENGRGTRRRLFAEDAAQCFLFVDLCRKKFDVVLMNPPFGQPPEKGKSSIGESYPESKFDLFATFLERGSILGARDAFLGAITTSAGFYRNQLSQWRDSWYLDGRMRVCADLGGHVLDDATVRTAAYVMSTARSDTPAQLTDFLRCNEAENKKEFLLNTIQALTHGRAASSLHSIDVRALRKLPGKPLAYWLPPQVRKRIERLSTFGESGGSAQLGLSTKDDTRFLRLVWEVHPQSVGSSRSWCLVSKGGTYSPYYFDVHLAVLQDNDFAEIEQSLLLKYPYLGENANWVLHRENNYYKPGITFQRRTNKPFGPRVFPRGCLFTDNGPSAFWDQHDLATFLAMFNSSPARLLAAVGNGALEAEGGGGANSYEIGLVEGIVVPDLDAETANRLRDLALEIISVKREIDSLTPDTRVFVSPFLVAPLEVGTNTLGLNRFEKRLRKLKNSAADNARAVDALCEVAYGFEEGKLESLLRSISPGWRDEEGIDGEFDTGLVVHNILSWATGCAFGRWDIRLAIASDLVPRLADPFEPLPICPPGMLVASDGLPATSGRITSRSWLLARPDAITLPPDGSFEGSATISDSEYPIGIAWDGILVDDPGLEGDNPHPSDIVRREREVLAILWPDNHEAIEAEACEILGVRELRDYFRKPAGFFADHLKRYSKSRRQAPIYWPLSTPSGSYTVWLYYHRLDGQILYAVVNRYVTPKIEQVEGYAARLEEALEHTLGGAATDLRDKLDQIRAFLAELRAFRAELLRIAELPYKPDLNDGVIINAAPLHRLFRLRRWAEDTEAVWHKLERGEYDWAHMAYTLWPERVWDKCKQDRSIAIAHGLEELCEIAQKRKGKS